MPTSILLIVVTAVAVIVLGGAIALALLRLPDIDLDPLSLSIATGVVLCVVLPTAFLGGPSMGTSPAVALAACLLIVSTGSSLFNIDRQSLRPWTHGGRIVRTAIEILFAAAISGTLIFVGNGVPTAFALYLLAAFLLACRAGLAFTDRTARMTIQQEEYRRQCVIADAQKERQRQQARETEMRQLKEERIEAAQQQARLNAEARAAEAARIVRARVAAEEARARAEEAQTHVEALRDENMLPDAEVIREDMKLLGTIYREAARQADSIVALNALGDGSYSRARVGLRLKRLQQLGLVSISHSGDVMLTGDGLRKAHAGVEDYSDRQLFQTYIEGNVTMTSEGPSFVNSPVTLGSHVRGSFNSGSFNVDSFNRIRDARGEDIANAVANLAQVVHQSGNEDAVELLEAVEEEVARPVPKKTVVQKLLEAITSVTSGVKDVADASEAVANLFT